MVRDHGGVRRSAHPLLNPGESGLLAMAEAGGGVNPHSVGGADWETTRCLTRQEPFAPRLPWERAVPLGNSRQFHGLDPFPRFGAFFGATTALLDTDASVKGAERVDV